MNLLILPKHELRGALDGCIGGQTVKSFADQSGFV